MRMSSKLSMRPRLAEVTDSCSPEADSTKTLRATVGPASPARASAGALAAADASAALRSMKNTREPSDDCWKTPGVTRDRSDRAA